MIYLEDTFIDHPKMIGAGDDGVAMWLRGVSWLKQQRSNTGRIPKAVVIARCAPIVGGRALAPVPIMQRLIDVGSWHDDGTHVIVHGYVERNEASIQRSELAKAKAEKRWAEVRERRAGGAKNDPQVDAPAYATASIQQMPQHDSGRCNSPQSTVPSPTRPTPLPQTADEPSPPATLTLVGGEDSRLTVEEQFEVFWKRYPRRNGQRLGKGAALAQWRKIPITDRRIAAKAVVNYAEFCTATGQLAKDAHRWLRDRLWLEHVEAAPVEPSMSATEAAAVARDRAEMEAAERRKAELFAELDRHDAEVAANPMDPQAVKEALWKLRHPNMAMSQ